MLFLYITVQIASGILIYGVIVKVVNCKEHAMPLVNVTCGCSLWITFCQSISIEVNSAWFWTTVISKLLSKLLDWTTVIRKLLSKLLDSQKSLH